MGVISIRRTSGSGDAGDVPRFGLSAAQRRRAAGFSVNIMVERVNKRSEGIDDSAFPPYSSRGPIYVPRTGPGRSKKSLGGREVLTPKDLRVMSRRGNVVILGYRGSASTPRGMATVYAGRTRNSIKFANYSDWKKALGKSGRRDLELSGRMLGSITMVRLTKNEVELGFTREEEERKAAGNEERAPWFGLSNRDIDERLTPLVDSMYNDNLSRSASSSSEVA